MSESIISEPELETLFIQYSQMMLNLSKSNLNTAKEYLNNSMSQNIISTDQVDSNESSVETSANCKKESVNKNLSIRIYSKIVFNCCNLDFNNILYR
jgi:hypothetical protein